MNKCFLCGDIITNKREAYFHPERYKHILYCSSECFMIAEDTFSDEELRAVPIPTAPELKPVSPTHAKIRRSIRNKTGVRGVSYCKWNKRWRVNLQVNKKRILCGHFKTIEEAIAKRKEMEIKYNVI